MRFALLPAALVAAALVAAALPAIAGAQDQRCQDWPSLLDGEPLFGAALVQHVTRCLASGADPNARDGADGETLLHVVAWGLRYPPAVAEILLAAGANPNAADKRGDTPLHALMRAVGYRPVEELHRILEALLEAGADPNARGQFGQTPLHDVASEEEAAVTAIVGALLAAGADPNATTDYGRTPLHSGSMGTAATVQTLLAAGADPNARDEDGETPLHRAAQFSDLTTLATLLAAGADPNARDTTGQLPAERCRRQGQSDPASCARLLARLTATARGRCLVPGFPDPPDPESLGLPWCPASVGFQVRSFAIAAAGMQCAIATGSSSTPEQVEARNRETADLCARLDAVADRLGVADCRCPADWR